MSEELYEYLLNHEPTEQEAKKFWASVFELEKQFAETTKLLQPTVNYLHQYVVWNRHPQHSL